MVLHYRYCPLCGAKLTDRIAGDDGPVPYCESCSRFWFDGFPSCVIVLTYNENNELLLTMQPHISTTHAVYTSGFIVPGETAEDAALREVKEELGIDLQSLTYDRTYWYPKKGMLMHAYFGYTPKCEPVFSTEVASAEWVPAEDAPAHLGPERPGSTDWAMLHRFYALHGMPDPVAAAEEEHE